MMTEMMKKKRAMYLKGVKGSCNVFAEAITKWEDSISSTIDFDDICRISSSILTGIYTRCGNSFDYLMGMKNAVKDIRRMAQNNSDNGIIETEQVKNIIAIVLNENEREFGTPKLGVRTA